MAQNYWDNCFVPTQLPCNVDMKNIESNFEALKSNFSGDLSPPNTQQFMNWMDTDNNVMKVMNSSANKWNGLFHADADQKIWQYRNDALDGWIIDTTPDDCVAAIRSNTSGDEWDEGGVTGSSYGDWDLDTLGLAHSHKWMTHTVWKSEGGVGSYTTILILYDSAGDPVMTGNVVEALVPTATGNGLYPCLPIDAIGIWADGLYNFDAFPDENFQTDDRVDRYLDEEHGIFTTGSTLGGSWRPKALIGTLQYLDL